MPIELIKRRLSESICKYENGSSFLRENATKLDVRGARMPVFENNAVQH